MALPLPVLDNRFAFCFVIEFWELHFVIVVSRFCGHLYMHHYKLYIIKISSSGFSSSNFDNLQVITGYLLAGSIIGPGGLSFVSEMVQVCCLHAPNMLLLFHVFFYFYFYFFYKPQINNQTCSLIVYLFQ